MTFLIVTFRMTFLIKKGHVTFRMLLIKKPSFSRPHGVSLFGNTERCVVSFSGPTSVQWSDVEHALYTFLEVY